MYYPRYIFCAANHIYYFMPLFSPMYINYLFSYLLSRRLFFVIGLCAVLVTKIHCIPGIVAIALQWTHDWLLNFSRQFSTVERWPTVDHSFISHIIFIYIALLAFKFEVSCLMQVMVVVRQFNVQSAKNNFVGATLICNSDKVAMKHFSKCLTSQFCRLFIQDDESHFAIPFTF